MDKHNNIHLKIFYGSNFSLWRFQMEIIFNAKKIMQIVDGMRTMANLQANVEAWDDHNNYAWILINT